VVSGNVVVGSYGYADADTNIDVYSDVVVGIGDIYVVIVTGVDGATGLADV